MRLVVDSFDLYLTVFHIATRLLMTDLFSLSYRACGGRGERESWARSKTRSDHNHKINYIIDKSLLFRPSLKLPNHIINTNPLILYICM